MSKARIDVMLSSTSRDLPEHRKEATDAVLRLGMFPVVMEHLTAESGHNAITKSLEMVDISEVYVGIFGMRYGYVPDYDNPNEISVTEMEYRRAKERDIPILIFIMDKTHPITADDFETDPEKLAKLNALKDELGKNHIVGFFKSAIELRALLIQGLAKVKEKAAERAGENDPVEEKAPEDMITRPPELLSLPRYTLTHSFIGREKELKLLDDWSQSDTPMMVVNAIGGMGKSALTWEWVNREAQKEQFDGRFWFSFYERGTNMTEFVRQALAYVKEVHPDTLKNLSRGEMADELRQLLNQKRVLLVLDGLERVLVAYHRIDASQVRDDEVENRRDTTDPKDGRLLKQLAGSKAAKLLLSTRLMPTALEDALTPILGVERYDLAGLHPDDAYTLMRERGVKEPQDRKLMDDFMAQFGYHGLLLNITAGRIKNFFRAPGDFDIWHQFIGKDLRDKDIQKARTKLLGHTFEGLSDHATKLLSQISAFSDAVEYDTLAIFNPFVDRQPPQVVEEPDLDNLEMFQRWKDEGDDDWDNQIEELTQQKEAYEAYLQEKATYEQYQNTDEYFEALAQFDDILRELTDAGLLMWERADNTYDLHPVVRGYSFDQLEDKAETFDKIHDHFNQRPVNYETATTIMDLHNAIMVYRALVGAGKLELAAQFYSGSFGETLRYALNVGEPMIALLTPLFTNGTDTFPPFADDRLKGSTTNDLADAFYRAGKLDDCIPLERANIRLFAEAKDTNNLTVALYNYAATLFENNQLAPVLTYYQLALELVQLSDDAFRVSLAHARLLRTNSTMGQWQQAAGHDDQIDDSLQILTVQYAYRVEKCFYKDNNCLEISVMALQKVIEGKNIQWAGSIWSLRARNHLRLGAIAKAAEAIDEAIVYANQQGDALLASFQATRALILHHRGQAGDKKEAQELLTTAIETNGWPSQFAHIYNCAAEVYSAWGELEQAEEYALKAYEYAWADGEPYVRWYDLQQAKKNLDALGVAHPDLPKYDESNAEKVFMEDEIRAYIEELKAEKAEKERKKAEEEGKDYFGAE